MKTVLTKISSRIWQWDIFTPEGTHAAGGYCATKADAANDSASWLASR